MTPRHSMLAVASALLLAMPAPLAPYRLEAPPPHTLEVSVTEFAFVTPDTAPAGRTRIRMTNRGREIHILELARLADGHTAVDLVAWLESGQAPPPWATFVGGPIVPSPGAESEVTVYLAPGRYALICPVPSPTDHRPHMSNGMVREIVVVSGHGTGERASASGAADGRVVLDDYAFGLEPAWRAGRRTVRVENRAVQPHEVAVFRLDPGRRASDVIEWARALTGPPPGAFVGGTTAVSRGETVTLHLTLTPGTYALLCFARDATDGRSHVAHGMVREVEVR